VTTAARSASTTGVRGARSAITGAAGAVLDVSDATIISPTPRLLKRSHDPAHAAAGVARFTATSGITTYELTVRRCASLVVNRHHAASALRRSGAEPTG
jgi:hypothetical protein